VEYGPGNESVEPFDQSGANDAIAARTEHRSTRRHSQDLRGAFPGVFLLLAGILGENLVYPKTHGEFCALRSEIWSFGGLASIDGAHEWPWSDEESGTTGDGTT
jgi:hypothetical protein